MPVFGVWPMATKNPLTAKVRASEVFSLRTRTPETPPASPSTSSTTESSSRRILPSATRFMSLSTMIFSARNLSRRWISTTPEQMLAR
ncbi:hypothetical protein D3C83_74950 [compost metagenome]